MIALLIQLLAAYETYAKTGKIAVPIHVQDSSGSVNVIVSYDKTSGHVDLQEGPVSVAQDRA